MLEVLLAAGLSVSPLLHRLAAGTGDIPAGDAWAYERIARVFHETGRIVMVNWNDITLVGMLPVADLWASFVGFGHVQLHVLGSLAGFVALLALLDALRTIGVERRWFPLLVFGTFVGFVGVSGTFLSDLFSAAGSLWGIAIALRVVDPAIRRSPTTSVAMSMGAALAVAYGFSVRQHAAAAAVAVVVLLRRRRDRTAHAWIAFAGMFLATAVPLYLWRMTVEHGGETSLAIPLRGAASSVVAMWFTLGLLALPLALRVPSPRQLPRWFVGMTFIPVAAVIMGALIDSMSRFTGGASVVGAVAANGTTTRWLLAAVFVGLATWAWLRMAGASLPPGWPTEDLAVAFGITVTLELAGVLLAGAYYPRYSLLSGAVLVCLLSALDSGPSRSASASTRVISTGVLGVLALASVWILDSSLGETRAVTEAGEITACAGIDPSQVDGGFVWNGMHHDEGAVSTAFDRERDDDGLPPTMEQFVFIEMERDAVFLFQPPDSAYASMTAGPVRATGLFPVNRSEVWIVSRPNHLDRIQSCLADRSQVQPGREQPPSA